MKISRSGNVVQLRGVIDENADFSPLLAEVAPLTIDFSGISRINSIGTRSWMKFMTDWGDKPIGYAECPVIISDQVAVTPSLMGVKKRVVKILSAYIAYDCLNCNQQEDRRVTRDQVVPNVSTEAKSPKCKNCGSSMQPINADQLSIF